MRCGTGSGGRKAKRGGSLITTATAKSVFVRLREVGFTRQYLTKVAALPAWWDDSLWDDPASRAVGFLHLSRHLGLDLASIQDPSATPKLKDFPDCRYKKQAGTTVAELHMATVIATRAAQLAASAASAPFAGVPAAADLRAAVLEDNPWVDLAALLDWCWSSGIPVLHVTNFPASIKKPTGFTLRLKGRPAVVLCGNRKQPAWQLFVLAHELGHLYHGHVPENGSLLDETANDNEPDGEEQQADQYAVELLTGRANTRLPIGTRYPKPADLAESARDFGRRNQIDPGHVVLNCANAMGGDFFPIAQNALKLLHPDSDAVEMIGERFVGSLDWDRLPEDSSVFLLRITGREIPE